MALWRKRTRPREQGSRDDFALPGRSRMAPSGSGVLAVVALLVLLRRLG